MTEQVVELKSPGSHVGWWSIYCGGRSCRGAILCMSENVGACWWALQETNNRSSWILCGTPPPSRIAFTKYRRPRKDVMSISFDSTIWSLVRDWIDHSTSTVLLQASSHSRADLPFAPLLVVLIPSRYSFPFSAS